MTTGADGRGQGAIPVQAAGSVEVEASASTPEQRVVVDSTYLWVMGGNEEGWGGQSQAVRIVADKKSYAPGDTAHLSILANVDSFHALVLATGYSVEFRKVLFSPGKALTFDLPITTDAQPNLEVSVAFIRNDQLYQANQSIKVPPVQEQLQIDITPAKQVFQPQQTASYDVFARDWQASRSAPISALAWSMRLSTPSIPTAAAKWSRGSTPAATSLPRSILRCSITSAAGLASSLRSWPSGHHVTGRSLPR